MRRAILHLIDSLDPRAGGPVEFVKAVSREHTAMGHKVSAALLSRCDVAPDGIEIAYAGKKETFGGYGGDKGFGKWLRANARGYDAIFVHGLWQYHGLAAWRANGAPYFVFPHGMLDPWFAGNRVRHWKKRIYWEAVEKHVLRNARAVLFTSELETARAPRSFGNAWRHAELVELGIAEPPADIEAQRSAFLEKFPALKGRRVLLFLGRIDRKKGCELLARAFLEMGAKDWELVMAGPCTDAAYRAEIESAGAPVHFAGMIEGAVKWGAFRTAEVFALPSHQENFGIAAVEALACGTPVLISTAVGIHRAVTESGAGFAERDDMAGTRRLLERWMELDAVERNRMKAAAENCFRTHFHIRRTAERMITLIE